MRLAAILVIAACSKTAAPPAVWTTDETAAFTRAHAEHRDVLVDVTAAWSVPSQQLSKMLDAMLPELATHFVPLRIDASNDTDAVTKLRERYGVETLPQIVVVTADGVVRSRVTTVLGPADLRGALIHVDQ